MGQKEFKGPNTILFTILFFLALIINIGSIVIVFDVSGEIPTYPLIVLALLIIGLYTNFRNIKSQYKHEILRLQAIKNDDYLINRIEKKKEKEEEEEKKTEKIDVDNIVDKLFSNIIISENKEEYARSVLTAIAKDFKIVQGIFYQLDKKTNKFKLLNSYAYYTQDKIAEFTIGEGITGQVAKNKKVLVIDNVPEDYITILSGLGSSSPNYMVFLPLINNEKTIGLIEIALFSLPMDNFEIILEKLASKIASKLI